MQQISKSAWLLGIALSLGINGCSSLPANFGMERLEDKIVGTQVQSGRLMVTVVDKGQSAYQTAYVRVLDWDTIEATLDKLKDDGNGNWVADPAFTAITKEGQAGFSTVRTGTVTLSQLTAGSNYRLKVKLKKDGTVIAQGTNDGTGSGFDIVNGANNVNVTLTMAPDGEVQITVPEPASSTTLSTNAVTNASFKVQRVAGVDQTHTGSPGALQATTADPFLVNLSEPAGVEVASDSTTVFVADRGHHAIQKITPAGSSVIAGTGTAGSTGDGGAATSATLNGPTGLALIPSNNTLYVADTGNDRIRRITPDGNIYLFAGGGADTGATVNVATSAALNDPMGLAIDSPGNVYFADYNNHRICKVDLDGKLTTLSKSGVNGAPTHTFPVAVAVDRTNKVLWFSSQTKVFKITDMDGATPGTATEVYSAPTNYYVNGLAYDHNGLLYLSYRYYSNGRYGNRMVRVPVDTTGSLPAGKSAEVVTSRAYDSSQETDTSYANSSIAGGINDYGNAPTAEYAQSLELTLAGCGFAGLTIDMSKSNSADTLSGILYQSQYQYNSKKGQVLKFTSSTLN